MKHFHGWEQHEDWPEDLHRRHFRGWEHHGGWPEDMYRRRRMFLMRFGGIFALVALLGLAGTGVLIWIAVRLLQGNSQAFVTIWLSGCGLLLGILLLFAAVIGWSFRGFGTPLANLMAAADAVADGDLSAQVPERGSGDMRRLARSFNRMARELQRADQQRRNLTADVAHELRTPLHVIQGNLEGILDGVYQPSEEHLRATLDETRQLARLVEDLQTLSLAEAGQLPLQLEQVEVADLLSDVITSFSSQAESQGVDLRLETDGNPAKLVIRADALRMDQVLANLVVNALRHTSSGGTITLRAELLEGAVRMRVSDTGEGIPPEDLPFIFDRFWRGDRSRSHAGGASSGLGLAISKQLVEAHGGQIEAESEPGHGTTFTIELPLGEGE
ncbi:MAG: ATP-binding protein [Anaerolineales bacterium]|jgi:two-component system OmpR family sensor kinase/two-component system sensor histidine kinase BaeS